MSYADLITNARRLRVLQTLHNATEYTADLEVLCDHLRVGMVVLVEDAGWLEDHGLVEMDQVDGVTLMRLARMGKDVALGRVQITGVRRPDPQ